MERILIMAFLAASINGYSKGQLLDSSEVHLSDTTVLPQILGLSLSNYINKPVDSLFAVLPMNYTRRGFMPERISYNRGVFQSYGNNENNNVSVEIYIDHYSYMVFPNRARMSRWDMSLARKEIISFIKITKNNKVCVYGCNNPAYDH